MMLPEEEATADTKCPYCGAVNSIESEFCGACFKHLRVPAGVRAAAKAEKMLAAASGRAVPRGVQAFNRGAPGPRPEAAAQGASYRLWARLALIAALGFWYTRWLVNENYFSFLDYINLAIHEAGHLFLGFFGRFIMMLGGTLFQLLLPAVCLFHLRHRNANLGWQVCLFWLGESLLNVSIYAGDALKQALPLVGGGEHDWTYLLTETGLIAHTRGVSRAIFAAGSLAIFWSLHLIWQDALARKPLELGDSTRGGFW